MGRGYGGFGCGGNGCGFIWIIIIIILKTLKTSYFIGFYGLDDSKIAQKLHKKAHYNELTCPRLCGQYKKAPM